jgi:hypothetical protein
MTKKPSRKAPSSCSVIIRLQGLPARRIMKWIARLTFLCSALMYTPWAAANSIVATVISMETNAYVRTDDGTLREIYAGDTLASSDILVTPDGRAVTLETSDGSRVTVSPEGEMPLQDTLSWAASLEPDVAVEDESLKAVLAALESGEDLGDVLGETAAGAGSPMAGMSVFGWLANRFGFDTPEVVAGASAALQTTGTTSMPAANQSPEILLPEKVRAQLLITRNGQILQAARNYQSMLVALEQKISERVSGGVSQGVDSELAKAWVTDAMLELNRASNRLMISIDSYEDRFGYRTNGPIPFPEGWDNRHEQSLESELTYLTDNQASGARRQWRILEMEQANLQLFLTRMHHLDAVRQAYYDQFDLGQRTLSDVIGSSRMFYDIEVQKIDTEYRLFDAHTQLLGPMGRLFEGDLSAEVDASE